MSKAKKTTTDAIKIMDAIWGKNNPQWYEAVAAEEQKIRLGMLIRETREARKLSQAQLAKLVGTSQAAISRLEDANYEGFKVETLRRIAAALKEPLTIGLGRRKICLSPERVKV